MARISIKKSIVIIFGLAVLSAVIFVAYVIETEKSQYRRNAEMADYIPVDASSSKVLVVYFSRSGNTELMAMEIAKHYSAVLVRLEADDYRIGLHGWLNALKDSQTKQASITPEKIELSQYDTVFIGSPIWWYSPAPPVWQFISNNDFTGKNVFLFNTFNSQFKQKYINEFKSVISERKGRFVKHIYVNRGRMTGQISPKAMLQVVREQLDSL